jgi:hypothetical protein
VVEAVVPIGRPKASAGLLTQRLERQMTPAGAVKQPPLPLQPVSQLVCGQAPCGSWNAGTAEQLPSRPAMLQALQPLQVAADWSQQNPSTQLPERHWVPAVQALPWGSAGTQLVPLHQKPVAQLASTPQAARQALGPQT